MREDTLLADFHLNEVNEKSRCGMDFDVNLMFLL